jgi:hypothetical protein
MGGVTKAVEKVVTGVGKAVENVVKNPLPVIETIALTYALGPAGLGYSTATSAAVSSAAVTAANGGDMNQIATAAASGYVGGTAAEAVGGGTSVPSEATKIASSAAGASAATVTSQLAQGKSFNDALEAGLTSGALAGATTGVIEETKAALAPPETGQGIKVVPGQGTQLLGDQTSVSGLGLTDKIPASMDSMGGASGLIASSNAILPPSLAKSPYAPPSTGRVAGTDTGGLQPAYTSAADSLTPSSFDPSIAPSTTYQEPKTVTQKQEPVISKTEEALARPVISGALSELFGLGPKVPGAPSAGGSAPISQGATTGSTTSLTGERGAGEIEGKETGKPRQDVWNEASLRLKDALGV